MKQARPRWTLLMLTTLALGCASTPSQPQDSPGRARASGGPLFDLVIRPAGDSLRLVLLGDTGQPGPLIKRWRAAVQRELKDAVLVAGDLVYPQAPPCEEGTPDVRAWNVLEERIGAILSGLGAPVLLALGNHDISPGADEAPRQRCIIEYTRSRGDLILPAAVYVADLGHAVVAVVDTNHLSAAAAARVSAAFAAAGSGRRKVLMGHHVIRTFHDKDGEDRVRPWLRDHGITPDLYLNGHAHLLQFGVYDGIAALTSGTAAKPRERPSCPPECGEGQLYGTSVPGYATVTIGPRGLGVSFKDADGGPLWSWRQPPVSPDRPRQ